MTRPAKDTSPPGGRDRLPATGVPADALLTALRGSTIVDLTLLLAEDLPCSWPGATPYRHTRDHWFEPSTHGGARRWSGTPHHTCVLELDEHTGTHFDAPSHFVAPPGSGLPNEGPSGVLTAEQIPIDQLLGPAAVVDVCSLVGQATPGASPRINPGSLSEFERAHGALRPGDIVLFRSRWDRRYGAGDRYVRDPLVLGTEPAWPAPSPETIALLVERGVRCVGTDGVSMGPADDPMPTHLVGLHAGMVFVEALCNLDRLPARGAGFVFLPLPIKGGSGGPGRALGFV